jgi:hypothetical protein
MPMAILNSRISARMLMKAASLLGFLALLFAPIAAWAGPPFQTDDPEPIDYRNYEFYAFAASDGTPIATGTAGPAVEFNWGALPNLHIHIIVPLAASLPSNDPRFAPAGIGPNEYGIGDIETGIKYRFIQEGKHRPMVGTFPMFELPSGDSRRGLGVGKVWYRLPIWAQKSFGPWTTYGGVGETVVPQTGFRNFTYGGWLLQRDIGKKLTLGTEVFSHGKEGLATAQTKASTLVDVGGYYYFRNPGFQLLFAYGHSAAGQTENYAYVGLYWTWGKKSADSDKDSGKESARAAPGFGHLASSAPLIASLR